MKVVTHQTVGIVGAVAAAGVALIIILHPHPVEGVNELLSINPLSFLESY